jgi:3-hydroxyacyl-[acyl-carrier-protein] dehydratase
MNELKLGAEVIQLLLPHRRPLLMVDCVTGYRRGEQPVLWSKRHVSANEEVFGGHFPDLHIWPGIYTQEGMGQSCQLLQVITLLQLKWEKSGHDPEEILRALRNLEMKYRLHPGYRPEHSAILERFKDDKNILGMTGSVEMRFHQPVFAGQCLEFMVARTHLLENMARFEVEATVEGRLVAKGKLTGAIGPSAA